MHSFRHRSRTAYGRFRLRYFPRMQRASHYIVRADSGSSENESASPGRTVYGGIRSFSKGEAPRQALNSEMVPELDFHLAPVLRA